MALSTKLNLSCTKFEQTDGTPLYLSGDTYINGSVGTIQYTSEPVSFGALSLINNQYMIDYVTGLTSGIEADITQICNDIDYISGQTDCKQDCITTPAANTLTYLDATCEEKISPYLHYYALKPSLEFGNAHNITGGTNTYSAIIGGDSNRLDALRAVMLGGQNNLYTGATYNDTTIVECLAIDNAAGTGNLLCIDSTTKKVGVTSLSAFGGITGGTNGVCIFPNQRLGLGGALVEYTQIDAEGFELEIVAANTDVIIHDQCFSSQVGGNYLVMTTGNTIYTSDDGVGIRYAADYSSTFVDSSLVSKCYVDTVATGLHPHDVVKVATTGNIDLDGAETIDGIAVTDGDRVLVKNQTTGSTNGIYVVNTSGAWTRATDFDGTPSGEVVNGDLVPVFTGATQANTIWVLTTPDPITVGTTSLTFTLFSRLLGIVAGDGIDVTPNGANQTVSVDLMSNGGLAICSTELAIADTIAGVGLSWSAGVINANVCSGGTTSIPVRYNAGDCLVVNPADINTALGGALTGATNGLTPVGQDVVLGGALTGDTTIDTAGNTLEIANSGANGLYVDAFDVVIGDVAVTNAFVCVTSTRVALFNSSSGGNIIINATGGADMVCASTAGLASLNLNSTGGAAVAELITCAGGAYLGMDGVADVARLASSGNYISVSGGSNVIIGSLDAGSINDEVVVRETATGILRLVSGAALGDHNNCYATTAVTSATLTTSNYVVLVDTAAARTITLPSSPTDGLAYKIKDACGCALVNNVTISANKCIDGSTGALINTDWGALNLVYDSTFDAWFSLGFIN